MARSPHCGLVLAIKLALALLGAGPAAAAGPACDPALMQGLEAATRTALRFDLATGLLPGILPVTARLEPPVASPPDGATIFAWPGRPLVVVLRSGVCILGVFEIERSALWDLLRRNLGPAI